MAKTNLEIAVLAGAIGAAALGIGSDSASADGRRKSLEPKYFGEMTLERQCSFLQVSTTGGPEGKFNHYQVHLNLEPGQTQRAAKSLFHNVLGYSNNVVLRSGQYGFDTIVSALGIQSGPLNVGADPFSKRLKASAEKGNQLAEEKYREQQRNFRLIKQQTRAGNPIDFHLIKFNTYECFDQRAVDSVSRFSGKYVNVNLWSNIDSRKFSPSLIGNGDARARFPVEEVRAALGPKYTIQDLDNGNREARLKFAGYVEHVYATRKPGDLVHTYRLDGHGIHYDASRHSDNRGSREAKVAQANVFRIADALMNDGRAIEYSRGRGEARIAPRPIPFAQGYNLTTQTSPTGYSIPAIQQRR